LTSWPAAANQRCVGVLGREIESETFTPLKSKGYNLEHSFGHGQEHRSALRAIMNLIAFAMHTVAGLVDIA
jgi:hypothetical protein